MSDSKQDKYDEIEQKYKTLQQQGNLLLFCKYWIFLFIYLLRIWLTYEIENETLNFFKGAIRGALEIADAREYSKTWVQYLPFSEVKSSLQY